MGMGGGGQGGGETEGVGRRIARAAGPCALSAGAWRGAPEGGKKERGAMEGVGPTLGRRKEGRHLLPTRAKSIQCNELQHGTLN